MSLSGYKKKRKFDETPEPAGKRKSSKSGLRFVVQKHDASHVHYDFRLEMEGVLKSWAVPKGPSLNPDDKRLAMMVEDHPYDYRNFEGIIPAGNYGGGTVIVWDEGTYEPIESENLSRKEQEKLLLQQLKAGSLKFILHGEKLNGEYALFLMKARGERSWILMKKNDEHASKKDITEKDKSVKSKKTLVQIAKEHGTTVNHPETGAATHAGKAVSKKAASKKTTSSKLQAPGKKSLISKSRKSISSSSESVVQKSVVQKSAVKKKARSVNKFLSEYKDILRPSPMPTEVIPMMANLVDAPFDGEDWIFEIKWDGYRAMAYIDQEKTELISRNLKEFTEKYLPITKALKNIKASAVLDGEIVAVNNQGLADFQSLQNWQNTPVHLQYCVFDILWLDGYDLTRLPLIERKKILRQVLPEDDAVLKYSDHVIGNGIAFFDAAAEKGLEGIMGKKANSLYHIDTRTKDWLKIKVSKRQEVVIAGYTEPRNSRKFFGSLLLGLYENDQLKYVGHTGSGFNVKSLEKIYKKLQPLVIEKCPFEICPKGNMPVTWVKPKLVCEVKFSEWTTDGMARHPIFMGLRIDKKAKDVKFEKAINMKKATSGKAASKVSRSTPMATKKAAAKKATSSKGQAADKSKSVVSKSRKSSSSSASTPKKTNSAKSTESLAQPTMVIDNEELNLTNLDKLYWKKEKFSKGDMINYYLKIAPYMMPYMLDRPQSLHRHPNGISGPSFFQKDTKGKVPDWIKTHKDFSESTNETVEYLVCSNEATLIYMANLGCIEMHPWHSRTKSWEKPDWCLIDLDPDKKNSFDQVMDVAKVVKQVLDSIGADAYCKTSGASGIHIYIPLGAKYDYDQSKQLAELIVTLVNQEMPDLTSVERSPAKRNGKLYLDYLQNRQTQTAAAAYSLRPKPGMPVSTPLDWSELKKGLLPTTYNALNIFDRLKTEGDLFKPVLQKGIDLKKVLGKLTGLMGGR